MLQLHFGVLLMLTLNACSEPPSTVLRSDAEALQDVGGAELCVDAAEGDSLDTGADSATCGIAIPASTPTWYDPWCMSNFCVVGGLCKFDPVKFQEGGTGCAIAPEMCPRSWICADTGRCSFDAATETCRASATSCEQCVGNICGTIGEFVEGQLDCVETSQEHCKVKCAYSGRCQFDAKLGRCAATSLEDCVNSAGCQDSSDCRFDSASGTCIYTSKSCHETFICKEWGLSCGSTFGFCSGLWSTARPVLLPDEATPAIPPGLLAPQDCDPKVSKGSCPWFEACLYLGLCGWDGQHCVPRDVHDCRISVACGLVGWCGVVGDRCGAVLDEDCVRCGPPFSWSSATGIHCSRTGDPIQGRCIPKLPSDCWYDCSQYGHCTLDSDRCVATNDSACSMSVRCKVEGACVVDPRTRECAIPLAKP
jgi:hypothetical protein